MIPGSEAETGVVLSKEGRSEYNPLVTRVGRVLQRTHLNEIPQLWSVPVSDMSVVGLRRERAELDTNMEAGMPRWRSRWFVKAKLTGFAQIRGATGYNPVDKIHHDIEYIRRQSF